MSEADEVGEGDYGEGDADVLSQVLVGLFYLRRCRCAHERFKKYKFIFKLDKSLLKFINSFHALII